MRGYRGGRERLGVKSDNWVSIQGLRCKNRGGFTEFFPGLMARRSYHVASTISKLHIMSHEAIDTFKRIFKQLQNL